VEERLLRMEKNCVRKIEEEMGRRIKNGIRVGGMKMECGNDIKHKIKLGCW
jgi:hypothetical protein